MTGHSLAALALRIEHQEIEEVGGPGPRSPRCQDIRDSSKGPGESLNHLFLKVGNIRASSHPDARICCFWLHLLSQCRCQHMQQKKNKAVMPIQRLCLAAAGTNFEFSKDGKACPGKAYFRSSALCWLHFRVQHRCCNLKKLMCQSHPEVLLCSRWHHFRVQHRSSKQTS